MLRLRFTETEIYCWIIVVPMLPNIILLGMNYPMIIKVREVLTPKAWDRNGQDLTAHFTTSIPLKGNVRNLSVKIRECTRLVWEWWRTVYEKPIGH